MKNKPRKETRSEMRSIQRIQKTINKKQPIKKKQLIKKKAKYKKY